MKRTGTERFIIDSCGWIEYFKGGSKASEFGHYIERATPENTFTPSIILYEVYRVFLRAYGDDEALGIIGHIKKNTTIVPLDDNIAIKAGEIGHELKIPMADAIILSTAREKGSMVITSDMDFKGIHDVHLIDKKD
jgi:predicted nucleic acid-binding protein